MHGLEGKRAPLRDLLGFYKGVQAKFLWLL